MIPSFFTTVAAGACFMPTMLVATSAVPLRDQGLGAGMLNAGRQIGIAVFLAVSVTVATAHTTALLAEGVAPSEALTRGYDRAFCSPACPGWRHR